MRIEDDGLIGNLRMAALVGRDGSIDWLCLPRFDSDACFAALLGDERHGRWLLAPAGGVRRVTRRYRPGTLILETEFECDEGAVRLVDCMPPGVVVGDPGDRRSVLEPDHQLGAHLHRPAHALRDAHQALGPVGGLSAVAGRNALRLWTPVEMRGEDWTSVASFSLRGGVGRAGPDVAARPQGAHL
jgi:Domain of unknown function (DUF5911)